LQWRWRVNASSRPYYRAKWRDTDGVKRSYAAVNEVAIDERANRYRFVGNDCPWNYSAANSAACPSKSLVISTRLHNSVFCTLYSPSLALSLSLSFSFLSLFTFDSNYNSLELGFEYSPRVVSIRFHLLLLCTLSVYKRKLKFFVQHRSLPQSLLFWLFKVVHHQHHHRT
jgi:hypothetical protein